jgi:NitT/TauT family transport system permease protein
VTAVSAPTGVQPDTVVTVVEASPTPPRLRAGRIVKPLVVLAALIVVWQVVVDAKLLPSFEVASPTMVWSYMTANPSVLATNTGTTLEEVALAFAIAVIAGTVLAALINQFRLLEESVLPLLVVSQVIPSIAIAPLLVLLLGFGMAPKVAVAAIISFFPILINTLSGLRSHSKEMGELTRSLGAGPWQTLRHFTLPNALPYVFSGARVAITLSVIGAVVGEFVTAKSGLGYLVLEASSQLNPALMFSALVVLAVIGIVLFTLVRVVEHLALPWARIGKQ